MSLDLKLQAFAIALGADHKSQQQSIATINNAIGSLPSLSTTNKTNLVLAINEVFTMAQSGGTSPIDDALVTSLVKTYSIDKIKTEILALKNQLLGGVPATAFDTLKEIADYIGTDQTAGSGMVTAIGKRVAVDQIQSFTPAEKTQARTNIEAYGATEIGNYDADLVALYTTAKA